MLEHARQRPQAPRCVREKEYGIWQTLTWAELAADGAPIACGLAQAGVQRGQHMVVIGDNRPRLYASMLAAQSLGAIAGAAVPGRGGRRDGLPDQQRRGARFAVVEDQEQVDKLLEIREQCPQLARIWFDDPRGLRNYDEPGLASLDALDETAGRFQRANPVLRCRGGPAQPDDVAAMFFTSAPPATPGRGAHHRTLLDRARPAPNSTADRIRRRCWPTCRRPGSGRTSSATRSGWPAATVNCPESAATVTIDLGDRPHLLLRAAAHLRGPADQRDDPHGRRRPPSSASCSTHGAWRAGRPRS